MKIIALKSEIEPADSGTIDMCPHMGCGFKCCSFQQGNYIVLHPGELSSAVEQNISVSHLQLLGPYNGGHKAVCVASNTANCDNGLKPLDCRSYPYFPELIDGRIVASLKGEKCPLPTNSTHQHAALVQDEWQKVAEKQPGIREWLTKVELVGYSKVPAKSSSL